MTLREIVEEVGGGIPKGKKLKGVLIGGPSGGCVPEHLCDIAVDYEALKSVGTIMGSGGLVVLDEEDCMVDISRYFMQFLKRRVLWEMHPLPSGHVPHGGGFRKHKRRPGKGFGLKAFRRVV